MLTTLFYVESFITKELLTFLCDHHRYLFNNLNFAKLLKLQEKILEYPQIIY